MPVVSQKSKLTNNGNKEASTLKHSKRAPLSYIFHFFLYSLNSMISLNSLYHCPMNVVNHFNRHTVKFCYQGIFKYEKYKRKKGQKNSIRNGKMF